jgi:hypothetical protein
MTSAEYRLYDNPGFFGRYQEMRGNSARRKFPGEQFGSLLPERLRLGPPSFVVPVSPS